MKFNKNRVGNKVVVEDDGKPYPTAHILEQRLDGFLVRYSTGRKEVIPKSKIYKTLEVNLDGR